VRLADHRRARGALDGVFDLGFDRVQVPSTICSTIGSTTAAGSGDVATLAIDDVPCAGSLGASRPDDQNAMRVDLERLPRKDHRGGAELFHHRGTFQAMAGGSTARS